MPVFFGGASGTPGLFRPIAGKEENTASGPCLFNHQSRRRVCTAHRSVIPAQPGIQASFIRRLRRFAQIPNHEKPSPAFGRNQINARRDAEAQRSENNDNRSSPASLRLCARYNSFLHKHTKARRMSQPQMNSARPSPGTKITSRQARQER
jgi:hypothetical protein